MTRYARPTGFLDQQAHLDTGGEAMLDLIVSGISLSVGSRKLTVDLNDKAVWRLFEQSAVVANAAIDIDSLNR